MDTTPRIDHLITHSGAFHADDVCAYALLSDLHPEAGLVRTRDTDTIARLSPHAVVFDVGRIYDPAQRRYDHHQPGAPVREDGLAYAAFGLIWLHRGQEWLTKIAGVPPQVAPAVHTQMAAGFVRDIDTVDVGVIPSGFSLATSLPGLIDAHNPPTLDLEGRPLTPTPAESDAHFQGAVALARPALRQHAQLLAREAMAAGIILEAARTRPHPQILVLDQSLPWERTVTTHPDTQDIRLVVGPNSTGSEWGVACARKTLESFESRRLLPEGWRGKTGDALASASGVPGATFCHTGGFYAALAGKPAALAFAHAACGAWAREDRMDRVRAKVQAEAKEATPASRPAKRPQDTR